MGVLQRYRDSEQGTIAVYTAIVALPLLLAVSYALDLKWAERNKTDLKSAADFAVLAAVNNNAISIAEKKDFAEEVFFANYAGKGEIDLSVNADASAVQLDVKAAFPTTITGLIGLNDRNVGLRSRAELTTEQVICVLALNTSEQGAITFQGNVDFNAPTCSVYSNSTSSRAIRSRGGLAPLAKGFCSVGSVQGRFNPYGNSQCRPMDDPYAGKFAPVKGDCQQPPGVVDVRTLPRVIGNGGLNGGDGEPDGPTSLPVTDPSLVGSPAVADRFTVLLPNGDTLQVNPGDPALVALDNSVIDGGTYCGGLMIAGRDVRMTPGDYYMSDGPLIVKDKADVQGDQVIVTLGGDRASFFVESEGSLALSAPQVGAHKGLVIMEDVRNPPTFSTPSGHPSRGQGGGPGGNGTGTAPDRLKSQITSSGRLSVTGTVYLPNHDLEIEGKGTRVGASAPSTSFIANTILFKGKGRIDIAVDHRAAGLPPVLPRSEDGARLTD